MPRQRVQDPEVRKQQILKAAQAVLTKKPYSHLVMEDIAGEADISKGLLYLYFKDKEALFAEAVEDLMRNLTQKLEGINTAWTPARRMEEMVSIMLRFGEEHKEFMSQFVAEQILSSGRAPRILESYESFLKILQGFFQDATAAGLMRKNTARTGAMVVLEIVMLYVRRKFMHKEFSAPLERYTGEIVEIIFSGFGRGSPPK